MALTLRQRDQTGWLAPLLLVLLAVSLGFVVGWMTARSGPLLTLAMLAALPLAALTLRSIWVPVAGLIAAATLLPFLVLPVSIAGAQPTLFELAAAGALAAYLVLMLLDRRERLVIRVETLLWALFASYLVFAFVLGIRFDAGADLARLFARFLLGLALFWLTLQIARTRGEASRLLEWMVAGTTAAAAIGLALYAGGPNLTYRVLVRLVPYGYPDARIVRFIEDNPENPMRAVGTGVDPNAFGGMMMLGFVLAIGLLFSSERRRPVLLYIAAAGLIGVAMILTFSRGAWVGGMTGAAIIVWFRARYLVPFGVAGGVAALAVGLGATFVSRLEAGLRLQDAATIQRLEEYENALEIIRAHPWFGIGFGDAPSSDFGVGVSSIYLLIAEQTGLVGLALFALFSSVVLWRGWQAFRATDDDLLLTAGAALAASLTVGLVDHYFFNIRFVHTVGFFWIVVGVVVALTVLSERLLDERGEV